MHRSLPFIGAIVAAISILSAQEPLVSRAEQGPDTVAVAHDMTRVNRLLGSIMSPFCPGLTLATCPSVYAETLRVSIRTRLEAGEAPDSIVESLVATFGEGIRGAPRARGMGLALWALPLVGVAGGGMALLWWLRKHTVGAVTSADEERDAPLPDFTPDEVAQMEAARRLLE